MAIPRSLRPPTAALELTITCAGRTATELRRLSFEVLAATRERSTTAPVVRLVFGCGSLGVCSPGPRAWFRLRILAGLRPSDFIQELASRATVDFAGVRLIRFEDHSTVISTRCFKGLDRRVFGGHRDPALAARHPLEHRPLPGDRKASFGDTPSASPRSMKARAILGSKGASREAKQSSFICT